MREQKHKEQVRIRRIHPQGEHSLSHTLTSLTVHCIHTHTYTHKHRLTHVTLETGLSRLKETKRKKDRERHQQRETVIHPPAHQGLSRN